MTSWRDARSLVESRGSSKRRQRRGWPELPANHHHQSLILQEHIQHHQNIHIILDATLMTRWLSCITPWLSHGTDRTRKPLPDGRVVIHNSPQSLEINSIICMGHGRLLELPRLGKTGLSSILAPSSHQLGHDDDLARDPSIPLPWPNSRPASPPHPFPCISAILPSAAQAILGPSSTALPGLLYQERHWL